MSLSKIDQAITVLRFHIKKKMRRVKEMEQKLDISENQKIFIGEEYEMMRATETLIDNVKNQFNAHLGKLPPHALDLEVGVLGAVILENGLPGQVSPMKKVMQFLKPEHFYVEAHQLIYKACQAIVNEPMNMLSVVAQLRKEGHIEQIGGAHYIAELTSRVSSSANIEYHARVIVEFAMKRQLIKMAADIMMDGYDDRSDCFELLDKSEEMVKEVRAWIK